MESPKRKSKLRMCRFFRCFNPSAVVSREPKKPGPILTYIAVPEKKVIPTVITSAFTAAKGGEGNASHRKKTDRDNNNNNNSIISNTNSDNSLRRALVAALNHTSLAKKLNRKRKANNGGFPRESSTNSSSKFSSYSSGSLGFTTTSVSSSTSTTLSTSSTMSSSSPSEPFLTRSLAMNNVTRKDGDGRGWFCGSNIALSVFFITSLLVLILCGRCYAIAYATTGFYVVPNRRRTFEE